MAPPWPIHVARVYLEDVLTRAAFVGRGAHDRWRHDLRPPKSLLLFDRNEPWLGGRTAEHELERGDMLFVRCKPIRLPIPTPLPITRGPALSTQNDRTTGN